MTPPRLSTASSLRVDTRRVNPPFTRNGGPASYHRLVRERFSTVSDFLAAQTPARRADILVLRELVREADPALVEIIKWNSPSYELRGADRLTIHAAGRGPVRLVLHFGTTRAEDKIRAPSFAGDPDGLLDWHSNIRATLALPDAEELARKRDAIVAVIRALLAES